VTCRENDDVDKAFKAMSNYQVRRIPVVNERNEIVGIIAQADIATRVEEPKKTAAVVEEISQPDSAR
jgi:CBS domain-containing protein